MGDGRPRIISQMRWRGSHRRRKALVYGTETDNKSSAQLTFRSSYAGEEMGGW